MKLQFAFGNPRRHKHVKRVAKRRKKAKTIRKTAKKRRKRAVAASRKRKPALAHKLRKAILMAKKHRRVKNPEAYRATKGGKLVGRSRVVLDKRQEDAAKGKYIALMKKFKSLPLGAERAKTLREMAAIKKDLNLKLAELKTMQRYAEEGAEVKKYTLGEKGDKKMAKRRKKHKKAGKKSHKRHKRVKAKSAAPKKHRRRRKSKKVAVAAAPKKRHHKRRRKGSKRRRMIKHSHSSSMRHLKKGASFRFKAHSKKGKRRITVSGRVKINPHRRNPLKEISAHTKTYLGLDTSELGALALGGALVPVLNSGIAKVPGMATVVASINSIVGPQAVGSVIPILAGVSLNALAEHAVKTGQAHDILKMVGEGLAAAGVIGLVMSFSQQYITPALGLSGSPMGIMPTLNGINYTPGMRGINYTPGMRGMGIMPQINGINYTPGMRGPDFGASPNYGGGGGSSEARTQPSDFGAWQSEDSESMPDGDNDYAASMN